MSAEIPTPTPTIIEIKKNIQNIVSKLMSDPQIGLTEDENKLIEQISKYRVAENLEELSNAFDNEFKPQATDDSGS